MHIYIYGAFSFVVVLKQGLSEITFPYLTISPFSWFRTKGLIVIILYDFWFFLIFLCFSIARCAADNEMGNSERRRQSRKWSPATKYKKELADPKYTCA